MNCSSKWSLVFLCAVLPLGAADTPKPERTPVLVELFTSEGCSSCPPADVLLIKLNEVQPVAGAIIIPLEEHVDYWDRQGWRDPFSSAEFTVRQQRYAQLLHVDSPYTPEMVIDGQREFLGSDGQRAVSEVAKAAQSAKIPVSLTIRDQSAAQASLTVSIDAAPAGAVNNASADVMLAITESGLASDVTRGENAGRNMKHSAVVRKLVSIGKWKAGKAFSTSTVVKFAREWKPQNLTAVVFVDDRTGGKVLGAAALSLSK